MKLHSIIDIFGNKRHVKLGKMPPKSPKGMLRLAKYIDLSQLPTPPANVDWTAGILDWGMMLNDNLGDCTCAAVGHAIQGFTKNATGNEITLPDNDILAAYEAVGGYVPGNESTDNGCVMTDVLNYWRDHGIGGHQIVGYAAINPSNLQEVAVAQWLFGGTYCGVNLPLTAQNQIGGVWDVVSTTGNGQPGSWGGHAIYIPSPPCVTWGKLQVYTQNFRTTYFDEEYVVITQDWISSTGNCPAGFSKDQLVTDAKQLTN